MRDDFLTADWASQHAHTTATIRNAIAAVAGGLTRLQVRNYDAPWRHDVTIAPPHHVKSTLAS